MNTKVRIALVAVPALYGFLELMRQFGFINMYWAQVMDLSLIITISALGLSLIYGFAGQFSLGHAAFYGIGAYTAGLVTQKLGGTIPWFVVALLVGTLSAGVMAYLIGLPILRLKSDYLGIATLGFGVIVKVFMDNTDKIVPSMGGSRGMLGIPRMASFVWIFWLTVGVILLARNLVNSAHGRAFMTVREDETSADIMGIDTTRFKTLAFVAGCSMAGLAGALYAHRYPFLHPTSFDFLKSFDVLLIIVLGGLGSLTGTVVTAVGWVFLLEWLRVILPEAFLEWRWVIYSLLLVVMMVMRPQGLFGGRELSLLPRLSGAKFTPKEGTKRGSVGM